MKTISVDLSIRSLNKAIAEIEKYKQGLIDKVKILVGQLVADGVEVARIRLLTSQGDSKDAYVDYLVSPQGDIVNAQIFMQGTDVLFIEFGAGIYYNNGNAHPQSTEFGYGVGTYPSEHPPNRAIRPGYWWYRDEAGGLHFSLGTEATMPIFGAGQDIRNNYINKAIQTFMQGG